MQDPESAIFDSTASRDPAKLGFRGDLLMCISATGVWDCQKDVGALVSGHRKTIWIFVGTGPLSSEAVCIPVHGMIVYPDVETLQHPIPGANDVQAF